MLVVDPHHWLDDSGQLPSAPLRLRRQILRVVRFIEYGGPLDVLYGRETLIECKKRPAGKPCLGLMWVVKTREDAIHAFCMTCKNDEALIHNWQDIEWAKGMMDPVPMTDEPLN